MAIALNNTPVLHVKGPRNSRHQAVLVPPAAVWEPGQRLPLNPHSSRFSSSSLTGVRTLSSESRTQGRTRCLSQSTGSSMQRHPRSRRGGSNVGNYVLGAVFGAAVFIGTVWGGLSIDSEVPNSGGASATAALSSR